MAHKKKVKGKSERSNVLEKRVSSMGDRAKLGAFVRARCGSPASRWGRRRAPRNPCPRRVARFPKTA